VTPAPGRTSEDQAAFERFVAEAGPRLGRALAAL
jgi:DNA-directed RNA polymerase specialized sigma24 family protein